jgi:hypothetical protein
MHVLKRPKLYRRTLLRGAGIAGLAIGLPRLDIMFNDHGLLHSRAHAQGVPAPKRIALFHWPNGAHMQAFTPSQQGANWWSSSVPAGLQPLTPYLSDINIVSGLSTYRLFIPSGGDEHNKANAVLLTSQEVDDNRGFVGGLSVDQAAIETLGPGLFLCPTRIEINGSLGMSYRRNGTSVSKMAAERNPTTLFNSLFANFQGGSSGSTDNSAMEQVRQRRLSILDYVKQQSDALKKKLGRADQQRVDEHLNSIRDIEITLQPQTSTPTVGCSPPASVPSGGDSLAVGRTLLDLGYLALACDVRSVVLYSMGGGGLDEVWAGQSTNIDDHETGHYGGSCGSTCRNESSQANIQPYIKTTQIKMEHFAYFLGKLKQGELLDSTMVAAMSDMSNGGWHSTVSLPAIVAGGNMQKGKHIVFPCGAEDTGFSTGFLPHCSGSKGPYTSVGRLWLTMLRAAGSSITSFGKDGTSTLPDLWT